MSGAIRRLGPRALRTDAARTDRRQPGPLMLAQQAAQLRNLGAKPRNLILSHPRKSRPPLRVSPSRDVRRAQASASGTCASNKRTTKRGGEAARTPASEVPNESGQGWLRGGSIASSEGDRLGAAQGLPKRPRAPATGAKPPLPTASWLALPPDPLHDHPSQLLRIVVRRDSRRHHIGKDVVHRLARRLVAVEEDARRSRGLC